MTKDTWQPSTNALKRVCHALWIEFCHRHCLKTFTQSLSTYQEATTCSQTELTRLYSTFKTALETAESRVELKLKPGAPSMMKRVSIHCCGSVLMSYGKPPGILPHTTRERACVKRPP